jgi:hypothetical protein
MQIQVNTDHNTDSLEAVVSTCVAWSRRDEPVRPPHHSEFGASFLADFSSWDYQDGQLFCGSNPMVVNADSYLHITCDYDTERRGERVFFGDGIDDKECLAWSFLVRG